MTRSSEAPRRARAEPAREPIGAPEPSPEHSPRNALNLAITRVVVCAVVLASSEVADAARWAEWARSLRAPVPGLGWALPLIDRSELWIRPVQTLALISTTLALVGWRARWTLPLAALTSVVLFALPHFTGGPRHSMHLVWFMLVLAFSPAALRLALPWVNPPAAPATDAAVSCELTLGVLRALLAAVYFFPGIWKLRESGLDWIFSDNLQNQMFWKWYQFGALPAWRVDHHPVLVRAGALGVVLLELAFPLLVSPPRGRAVAAALGLAFHVAAARLMFLPFASLFACYVVLVDWEWILAWLADERPAPAPSQRRGLARAVREVLRDTARDVPRHDSSGDSRHASGGFPIASRLLASSTSRGLFAGCLLLAGAVLAGASGQMRAYPFACYPTFQWIAAPRLPDLWIELERAGERRWLPDSPAHGGVRPQARWGMAWRAAGIYGDPIESQRLLGYYQSLPPAQRGEVHPGDRVRFYRAEVSVHPDAWREPPLALVLLAEVTL